MVPVLFFSLLLVQLISQVFINLFSLGKKLGDKKYEQLKDQK